MIFHTPDHFVFISGYNYSGQVGALSVHVDDLGINDGFIHYENRVAIVLH